MPELSAETELYALWLRDRIRQKLNHGVDVLPPLLKNGRIGAYHDILAEMDDIERQLRKSR